MARHPQANLHCSKPTLRTYHRSLNALTLAFLVCNFADYWTTAIILNTRLDGLAVSYEAWVLAPFTLLGMFVVKVLTASLVVTLLTQAMHFRWPTSRLPLLVLAVGIAAFTFATVHCVLDIIQVAQMGAVIPLWSLW